MNTFPNDSNHPDRQVASAPGDAFNDRPGAWLGWAIFLAGTFVAALTGLVLWTFAGGPDGTSRLRSTEAAAADVEASPTAEPTSGASPSKSVSSEPERDFVPAIRSTATPTETADPTPTPVTSPLFVPDRANAVRARVTVVPTTLRVDETTATATVTARSTTAPQIRGIPTPTATTAATATRVPARATATPRPPAAATPVSTGTTHRDPSTGTTHRGSGDFNTDPAPGHLRTGSHRDAIGSRGHLSAGLVPRGRMVPLLHPDANPRRPVATNRSAHADARASTAHCGTDCRGADTGSPNGGSGRSTSATTATASATTSTSPAATASTSPATTCCRAAGELSGRLPAVRRQWRRGHRRLHRRRADPVGGSRFSGDASVDEPTSRTRDLAAAAGGARQKPETNC